MMVVKKEEGIYISVRRVSVVYLFVVLEVDIYLMC